MMTSSSGPVMDELGEEQHRLGRHRQAGLGGVVGVVQAHADDLADAGHRAAVARLAVHAWQRGRIQRGDAGQRFRRQRGAADVGDHAGQVAQRLGVDEAGFFLAGLAVADEFHAGS